MPIHTIYAGIDEKTSLSLPSAAKGRVPIRLRHRVRCLLSPVYPQIRPPSVLHIDKSHDPAYNYNRIKDETKRRDMHMHWDRKLGTLAVLALVLAVLAASGVVWWTQIGAAKSGEKIAGRAEDGYRDLMERVADAENVGHPMIARRGKYDTQNRYADFDEAWLTEMVLTGHEYLEEEVSYTHTVKFLLRTYDTENIYLPDDTRKVFGRYTDEAMLFVNGRTCYVMYRSGETEYRFIAECAPLTDWLAEVDG